MSIGVAGWILGFLLSATGYQSGEVQSAETISGLIFIMTMVPLALILGAAILMWRYPIDLALHERIVSELEASP